jgi:tetratricopeptide (TPR) repeat protein
LSEQLRKAPRGADYPQSVYATFDLAIGQAASLCPQAERLMEIAAFFAPDRIPVSLFTEDVMRVSERDDALAALAELSLITHETLEDGTPAFTVHRLVQAVMRDRLGDGQQAPQQIALCLIHNALRPINVQEHSNWPQVATLLPHALKVLDGAPEDGEGVEYTSWIYDRIATYFQWRGSYEQAAPLYQRALAIAEAAHGPDHPDTGRALNNLAGLYEAQGRYEDAGPLYQRALAIAETALGPDHPNTGIPLNNLAGLSREQGRYQDARPLYQRALDIAEAALGPDHPGAGSRRRPHRPRPLRPPPRRCPGPACSESSTLPLAAAPPIARRDC